jgi:hypothetical protein
MFCRLLCEERVMPRRPRRSTLAARRVGAAEIWQARAAGGQLSLQRPPPCGSAWMQAGQGPGSLRGWGESAGGVPLTRRLRSAVPGPGRGADAVRAQVRGVHANCRRVKGALDGAGRSSCPRPQAAPSAARRAPASAHSPRAHWVIRSPKLAIYDFLCDPGTCPESI